MALDFGFSPTFGSNTLSLDSSLLVFARALVVLYLDGNDHTTIGEVLGISASNVGTKLDRIKTRLRATANGGIRGAR